jgi:hypothetical protein
MDIKPSTITLLLVIFSLSPSTISGTEIYKHVGKDGHITFTNRPIKGAKKFLGRSPSSKSHFQITETQKNFPKVSTGTQKKRDLKRREILLQELSTEEMFLTRTKKNLSQINKTHEKNNIGDNIKSLQDKLLLHERNIMALKKELANL